MIIGFDGSRAFQKERTGTENYSYQLLKALSKIDRKNQYIVYLRPHSVILNVSEGSQDSNLEISRFARNDNANWPGNFKFKAINWPRLWTQAGLARQTFFDKLDVLFIPAHTSPLIHKKGLKTVVTVHDLGAEYLPAMHQLKQRLYLKWITHYQLKSATKLIAVSKATKNDLVKRVGIDPEKIELVYEGYDKDNFKYQISKIKNKILVNSLKRFDIEKGKYFLFVGTVQPRKNLERIIKAFAIHLRGVSQPNLKFHLGGEEKLVIVGSKGWLSDQIYKLPGQLGIESQVKFLGYVPDDKLPALYSGAIALVFPSFFEGFGLPILEAQSVGCPVITSNISSMPEVAGAGAIFVDPHSIDDIVKGMIRIKNQELRIKLIKQGFENIRGFSWEKCARETLEVLEGI